jgi:hypothetical protein
MDPSLQVALVGIVTTFVTTTGVVVVAVLNNRKERAGTAESAIIKVLEQRLTLRDEKIADLREDVMEREQMIAMLRSELRQNRQRGGPE